MKHCVSLMRALQQELGDDWVVRLELGNYEGSPALEIGEPDEARLVAINAKEEQYLFCFVKDNQWPETAEGLVAVLADRVSSLLGPDQGGDDA